MAIRKLQYPTELPGWKGVRFLSDDEKIVNPDFARKVRKTDNWGDEYRVSKTFNVLTHLKNNSHPTIVTILDCVRISPNEYSYDMPLLAKLSDSEGKLVDLLSLSAEGQESNQRRINRLSRKHPKLSQVIKKINSWGVYLDLHDGNVMRDRYGNYKLIDIEGFGFGRFSDHEIIDKITARR